MCFRPGLKPNRKTTEIQLFEILDKPKPDRLLELSNLSDRSPPPAWERSPGRSGVLLVMTEIVWDGVTRSAPLRKEHKK